MPGRELAAALTVGVPHAVIPGTTTSLLPGRRAVAPLRDTRVVSAGANPTSSPSPPHDLDIRTWSAAWRRDAGLRSGVSPRWRPGPSRAGAAGRARTKGASGHRRRRGHDGAVTAWTMAAMRACSPAWSLPGAEQRCRRLPGSEPRVSSEADPPPLRSPVDEQMRAGTRRRRPGQRPGWSTVGALAGQRPPLTSRRLRPLVARPASRHTVLLRKMRHFRTWPRVVFLSLLTALIAIPRKKKTRPQLPRKRSTPTPHLPGAGFKVLDPSGRWSTSTPLAVPLGAAGIVRLAAATPWRASWSARTSRRARRGATIHLHELLYPLAQGTTRWR